MVKPRLALGYSILLTVVLFSTFISSSLALGPRVEASAGLSYHLAPPLVKPSQAPELSPTVVSATREGKAAGPISVIALLVEFKNLNHTLSREEVKDKVIGKVSEYYREASNGLAWVVGDVAGWYKLSQTVSYYGRDGRMVDDPNFDGVIDSWWLIRDAVAAADPDVDFAQYDYVVVVHAGYGQESSRVSDDLWSVAYWGGVWVKTNDGKSVYGGVIAPELEDRGADPFGVYCHELAHLVGLPDLYGEGGAKNWVDRWSLMDRGLWNGDPPGSSPAHPDAWSKLKLAWASGSQVAQVNASLKMNLTLTTTGSQEGEYRVVKVPVDQYRYYLVEARAKRGFDAALPGEGVLIYSINEKLTPGDGRVRLLDGHGETATLNDASYQPGEGYVDSANSIRIQILTQQGDGYLVMVDRSGPAPDIAVTKVYFQPTAVQENETVTILGAVANLGVKAANNFKLNLYINDQPYKTFTLSLKPGANATVQADWVAKSGLNKVRLALDRSTVQGDANPDNDQYTADLPVGYSIIVEVPYNLTVKVNGVEHKPSGDGRVEIPVLGGEVTLELEQTIPLSEGVRAAFKGWSDGDHSNPRKLYVDRTLSLKALFQKEYRVDVDPGGGAVQGAGWYPEGSEATVKAVNPTVLEENKHRLLFQGWGGGLQGSDPTLTFLVNGPVKLQANWKNQYYLTVSSPIGPVSGSGWYDEQAVARFGVEIPVVEEEDTRRTFEGWRGDFAASAPNGALTMDGPKKVEAVWKVEYKVKVESPYGQPTGSGWYQEGETAEIAVASMVDHGNGTRHVFQAWRGDVESVEPSIQLKVDRPKHLWAEWSTMYLLTLAVKGVPPSDKLNITVNGQPLTVNASKPLQMWVPAGETVTLNATKTIPAKYGYYMLDRWENATGTPVESVLTADNPITVNAVYKPGVGCLIATATYGSELTPQVSFLRSFRDTQIMESKAGRSFMNAFNAWYYSFSPNIALWINNHEPSKPPIRGALTPLLSILTVTAYLYEVFNVNPEAAALISGLTASLLIGVVYLSPVGGAVTLTLSRGRRVKEVEEWLKAAVKVFTLSLGLSLTAVALGEFTCNGLLLSASTATLVLTSLGLGALTPLTLTALLKNRTGGLHVW